MSQQFVLIDPNKIINECNADINKSMLALVSSFSGESFPTNVYQGMFCYRTDENKLYQLRSASPNNWVLVADLSRSGTDAITAERLAVARKINGVVFDGTADINLDITRSFTAKTTAPGSVDWNSIIADGTYNAMVSGSNPNGPMESDSFYVDVYVNNTNITQLAKGYKNNNIYMRSKNVNTWSKWEKFVRSSDMPTKLPADGGDADTLKGHGAEYFSPTTHKHPQTDITDFKHTHKMEDVSDKPAMWVVETRVEGTSWYKKYNNGWVEQGGRTGWLGYGSRVGVTFLIPFINTNYSATYSTEALSTNGDKQWSVAIYGRTMTGMAIGTQFESSSGGTVSWEVKGMYK